MKNNTSWDPQTESQMAAFGHRKEDLQPEPFNTQKHADRQPIDSHTGKIPCFNPDCTSCNAARLEAMNAHEQQKNYRPNEHTDEENATPQLDWRERIRNENFELGTTMDGDNTEINYPKLESFIAEVEKLAEERGYDKAIEYKKHFASFDELKQGLKHTDEIRSSLKAELIEAGEKMKTHSFIERSVNEIISDYQDIIKSA